MCARTGRYAQQNTETGITGRTCLFAIVVKVVRTVCVIVVCPRHSCKADPPTSYSSARAWSEFRHCRRWFAGVLDVVAVYEESAPPNVERASETRLSRRAVGGLYFYTHATHY